MNRRRFLVSGAAAGALRLPVHGGVAAAGNFEAGPEQPGMRILFFDCDCLAEASETSVVPPPLKKLGPVLTQASRADDAGVSAAMGCYIMDLGGRYRLYYTARSKSAPQRGICIAESSDGIDWTKPRLGQVKIDGEDTNRLAIEGLPEEANLIQPSIVHLPDGRWRMYGWLGRSRPRILRYIACESLDGLRWKAVNVERPCLRHPLELSPMGSWSWLDGPECTKAWHESGGSNQAELVALKYLRSNDVTHTYAMPSSGYEMFSTWALPNRPGSGRRMEHDNARAMLRVIHRRTSEDGLNWSDPDLIVVPDEEDAWDQQFYYLAQHRIETWRIGFLGRYRIVDQDMDIEFVYSRDGRTWRRPTRGAWLPRGPEGSLDSTMVSMPSHLIDRRTHWLALYSAADVKHHTARDKGRHTVHALEIRRHRFAGLASPGTLNARIRTLPFILPGSGLRLDAAVDGSLRAELCNAFGQPFPGFSLADAIPISGDSEHHELKWKDASLSDYQHDAVSVRLEWTRGTVYALSSPGER